MSNYSLYGECLIHNDDTMRNFTLSVMRSVDENALHDLKIRYRVGQDQDGKYEEQYMEQIYSILWDDVSRTDIDYPALMQKFAPEIGPLLFLLENQGYDLNQYELSFFGPAAKVCFNDLIYEMARQIHFCGDPLAPT